MFRKLLKLFPICISITLLPVSNVLAFSTGTGSLSIEAYITYNSSQLQWIYGPSSLETWNLGQIYGYTSGSSTSFADQSNPTYDYEVTPGWDLTPQAVNISYNLSSSAITNNHEDPFAPQASSAVAMSTAQEQAGQTTQSYANIMYFASLEALSAGSFTFGVTYSGNWSGTTGAQSDQLSLYGSLNASVCKPIYDENGSLSDWGSNVGNFTKTVDLFLKDGESGSIDDFTGQEELTVNFEAGDRFYLRFDGVNQVWGYSEDQPTSEPVPEPTTILLLGSGFAILVLARKEKRTS